MKLQHANSCIAPVDVIFQPKYLLATKKVLITMDYLFKALEE